MSPIHLYSENRDGSMTIERGNFQHSVLLEKLQTSKFLPYIASPLNPLMSTKVFDRP